MKILPRIFYTQDTAMVARALLGAILVRKVNSTLLTGMIVETEAYGNINDPASHASCGKTPRNVPMFRVNGCAYVYFIYGNHFCFNVVAKEKGAVAGAVLIRAVQPLEGIGQMRINRNNHDLQLLTNGPGKFTQAFGITREHNGIDLTRNGALYIIEGEYIPSKILSGSRVGIKSAQDLHWRFWIAHNQWVSRAMKRPTT
jgi:DNA-3-methyladenine glycosylase